MMQADAELVREFSETYSLVRGLVVFAAEISPSKQRPGMRTAVLCALALVLEGAAAFQPAPCGSLAAQQLRRRPASCVPRRAAPLAGAPLLSTPAWPRELAGLLLRAGTLLPAAPPRAHTCAPLTAGPCRAPPLRPPFASMSRRSCAAACRRSEPRGDRCGQRGRCA